MTRIFRLLPRVWRSAVVFVFHDVFDGTWFEGCIREIASVREILPLEEVASRRRPGTCALTFDDGRRSVGEVVHPVLRKRRLPYTVFICSDVLKGGPVPWFMRIEQLVAILGLEAVRAEWRLPRELAKTRNELMMALKEIPLESILSGLVRLEEAHVIAPPAPRHLFLQLPEVTRLATEDVSFQAHSHRHPILAKLRMGDQRIEIEKSRDEIESLVGIRPSHFAYPNGTSLDFDDVTVSILRETGFTHAYTTMQRHLSSNDDPFALPRIGISAGEPPSRQALKQLAPWMSQSHRVEAKIRRRMKEAGQGRASLCAL